MGIRQSHTYRSSTINTCTYTLQSEIDIASEHAPDVQYTLIWRMRR